jgi:hypothetical protein
MKPKRVASSGSTKPTTTGRRRALRTRPVPRWLTGRADLDQVAQRRCLLVLSVLSGEKPVTTAITELGISRPLYYQLETRALLAMLQALAPGASSASSPEEASPAFRIADLEERVRNLEQDKRRLERLLFLTRKVLPPGPVAVPSRRGRKPRQLSSGAGLARSRGSTRTTKLPPASPSIPTPDGATTP